MSRYDPTTLHQALDLKLNMEDYSDSDSGSGSNDDNDDGDDHGNDHGNDDGSSHVESVDVNTTDDDDDDDDVFHEHGHHGIGPASIPMGTGALPLAGPSAPNVHGGKRHVRRRDDGPSSEDNDPSAAALDRMGSFRFSSAATATTATATATATTGVRGGLAASVARFHVEHPSVSFGDGDVERGGREEEVERYGLESSATATTTTTGAVTVNNGEANRARKSRLAAFGETILGKASNGGSTSLKATAMVTKAQKNGKHVRGSTGIGGGIGIGIGIGGIAGIGGVGTTGMNGVPGLTSFHANPSGRHVQNSDDDGDGSGSGQNDSHGKRTAWLPSWLADRRRRDPSPPPRDVDLDDRIWYSNNRHPMDDVDVDDDDDDFGHANWTSVKKWKRGVAVVFVIATMTVGSAFIGFAIPKEGENNGGDDHDGDGDDLTSTTTTHTTVLSPGKIKNANHTEEELMNIAREVTQKCDVSNLKQMKGRQECQTLCHQHLCCFDEDATDGYNCVEDKEKFCGVYAGCEALVVDESTVALEKLVPTEEDGHDGHDDNDGGDGHDDENDENLEENMDESEEGITEVRDEEGIETDQEHHVNDGSDVADADATTDGNEQSDEQESKITTGDDSKEGTSESEGKNDANTEQNGDVQTNIEEIEETVDEDGGDNQGMTEEQQLLEIAESIATACGESSLVTETGRLKCEHLCNDHYCCFDNENSCVDDEDEMCMVYVGCADLFQEVSM